jgi:hypothetical protein
MKRTLAAVVAAVLLIAGCTTGQGIASGTPGSTPVAPSPSLAPTPTPVPALPVGADLEAGTTYRLGILGAQQILVTVPASGWFTIDSWFLGKDGIDPSPDRSYDMALIPYFVGNVYADPCHWKGSALAPPVGQTVDDLASALVAQGGPGTPPATDVTVGGYPAKKVELVMPAGLDNGTCDEGDYGRWSPAAEPDWYGPFTYGMGQHDTVYIIDVESRRWVIDTNYLPGTSAANLAELEQLVASIRFEL